MIAVTYLDQLPEYNMSLICTNVVPDFMLIHNGLVYTGSTEGVAIVNLENGEEVFHSLDPAYSMVKYNGEVYVATNGGILVLNVSPLPIYKLCITRDGGPPQVDYMLNGSVREMGYSESFLLEPGVYNFTFFNTSGYTVEENPLLVTLDGNENVTVRYVGVPETLTVQVNGVVMSGHVDVNGTTYPLKEVTNITIPYGVYNVTVVLNGVTHHYLVYLVQHTTIQIKSNVTTSLPESNVSTSSPAGAETKVSSAGSLLIPVALIVMIGVLVLFVLLARVVLTKGR